MSENYAAPTILIGHSLGGAAVLQSAREIPTSVAVVIIESPAQPSHLTAMFKDDRDEIERNGQATVQLGGRPFVIKKQLLDDLEAHLLPESIAGLQRVLLVMYSPVDDIVSIQNASDLFLHEEHPKSFASLDRADHLLSKESDSQYVGEVVAAWASRFIRDESPASIELPKASDDRVARIEIDGFRADKKH